MGFLKDIRKLTKQAKQMGTESGVDTSVRGLLRQAPGMIQQASDALSQVQAGKAAGDGLRTVGAPGRAVLLSVKDTGMTLGGTAVAAALENPVADLELEVTFDDAEPYQLTVRQMVPRLAVARLVPGTELPVLVDPADPRQVLVDWDAPPT